MMSARVSSSQLFCVLADSFLPRLHLASPLDAASWCLATATRLDSGWEVRCDLSSSRLATTEEGLFVECMRLMIKFVGDST